MHSSAEMGANCFALFLGSQRSWTRPPLQPDAADKFREQCSLRGFDPAHILPHGSYLMNCGSPKEGSPEYWQMSPDPVLFASDSMSCCCFSIGAFCSVVFQKSQNLLVDELGRCSLLGLNLFNFHPGSSLGSIGADQCCEKIAGAMNHAHRSTAAVVTGARLVKGLKNDTFERTFASRVTVRVLTTSKYLKLSFGKGHIFVL